MTTSLDASDEPRQGDHLPDVQGIHVVGAGGSAVFIETPRGVVLLTQCCDLARGGKGYAHVARVVELSPDDAASARRGRARHVPLPGLGSTLFADIGVVGGMTHEAVDAQSRTPAVGAIERHLFGQRVGRRFSRFAFPDEAQPLVGWIVGGIRKKADSLNSPMGPFWQRVLRIRLEVSSEWENPPWDVTVLVIVGDGELPTSDYLPEQPEGAAQMTFDDLTALGVAIAKADRGSAVVGALWHNFEKLYADHTLAGAKLSKSLLSSLAVEVVEESEFSYARFRRSANLDVDHVSGPLIDD